MKCSDIIKEIEIFITNHKNDDGGAWEYGHTPHLVHILKNLDEEQSKEFSEKIWDWDDYHLYEIADPILMCNNDYLDDFIYIKIFSKINNIEYLDYLVENLIHYIRPPYYSSQDLKNWDIDTIINLKRNVSKVIEVKDGNWKTLNEVVEFLNNEIETRNSNIS